VLWLVHSRSRDFVTIECFATGDCPSTYLNVLTTTLHFLKMWDQESGAKEFAHYFGPTRARMRFVDHHLAHAISAYGYSGFDDAAIVVMGRAKELGKRHQSGGATTGRSAMYLQSRFPTRVGHFYSEFTEFLGFQRNSDE